MEILLEGGMLLALVCSYVLFKVKKVKRELKKTILRSIT